MRKPISELRERAGRAHCTLQKLYSLEALTGGTERLDTLIAEATREWDRAIRELTNALG